MIFVSNTTPLIGLASIDHFELLEQLFGELHIPEAVYSETVVRGREHGGARREVSSAAWIKRHQVVDRLAVDVLLDELDAGEAEAIVLARELKADWVLMDERKGRRKLTQLGIRKIGTLGILLRAKQSGLLTAIRPEIVKLEQQAFNISQAIVTDILNEANERSF